MAALWLEGKIIQETTKVDKENERETVFQIKASLDSEECADLQRLIGRQCWMHIEDSISHQGRRQERAGQLPLPLDGAPAAEPEPAAPTLAEDACICGHGRFLHTVTGDVDSCIGADGQCLCSSYRQMTVEERQAWLAALAELEAGSDSAATNEGEESEPPIDLRQVLWVHDQGEVWHACMKPAEGQESPGAYLCGAAFTGGECVAVEDVPDDDERPFCVTCHDILLARGFVPDGSDSEATDVLDTLAPEDFLAFRNDEQSAVDRAESQGLADEAAAAESAQGEGEGFAQVVVEGFIGGGGQE